MEGARGIAVALVFLVHYFAAFGVWTRGTASEPIGQFLWTIGNSGVDLFFVLSGYLIYSAVVKPRVDYAHFLRRRLQRIYPTFLVVFAVYLALSFVFPAESKLPASPGRAIAFVVENLLLLPGIFPITAIVTVAWSLSYEFFYYLALPLLAATLRFAQWRPPRRLLFFVLLGIAFAASWFLFRPFAPRLLMFVAGIVVYEEVKRAKDRGSLHPVADWVIFATTVATFPILALVLTLPHGDLHRVIVSAIGFGLFVYACFRSRGPVARACSWAPLRWLGNMSYSYYLIHALTINACRLVLLRVAGTSVSPARYWLAMPLVFAATLVTSTLLFALVERPFSLVTRRQPAIDAIAVS